MKSVKNKWQSDHLPFVSAGMMHSVHQLAKAPDISFGVVKSKW
jgi:hypothetical protein